MMEVRELYPAPTGKLILRGMPLVEIVSMKSYLTGGDLDFTVFKDQRVELARDSLATFLGCGPQDRVDVVYRYGAKPSEAIQQAIDVLAEEMKLSDAGSGECRLPDRVTSVNRQGVSWTLIDPQDFIDNGRTGITEIDLILKSGGKARMRARVFSPEFPPPKRLESQVVPEDA